jgi:hypothetical protein
MAFHLSGIVLPDDEERDLYMAHGRITLEPVAGAETVVEGDDRVLVPYGILC